VTDAVNAYENFDLQPDADALRQSPVRFAFEFPELLTLFAAADATANRARDRNRRHGVVGVCLVLVALLSASASPLLHNHETVHSIVGVVAAGLGIVGTALGLAGVRRTSQRRTWLTSRVTTETLRLFHFYYIVARAPEIAAAAADAPLRDRYLSARRQALDHLMATDLRDAGVALTQATDPKPVTPFRAVTELPASLEEGSATSSLFDTWRTMRLDWQLTYCNAKLAHHRTGHLASPVQLEHRFSTAGWVCIMAVVLLHLAHFAEPVIHLPAVWVEVAIVWAALIALALRALEDGLKPQREVERYEQYRAKIMAARERFDAAPDMAMRLEVMRSFEQTSFEELRVFLRSHAEARFLL
jgi:hypothetical protein